MSFSLQPGEGITQSPLPMSIHTFITFIDVNRFHLFRFNALEMPPGSFRQVMRSGTSCKSSDQLTIPKENERFKIKCNLICSDASSKSATDCYPSVHARKVQTVYSLPPNVKHEKLCFFKKRNKFYMKWKFVIPSIACTTRIFPRIVIITISMNIIIKLKYCKIML